jgi:hypothetical protein
MRRNWKMVSSRPSTVTSSWAASGPGPSVPTTRSRFSAAANNREMTWSCRSAAMLSRSSSSRSRSHSASTAAGSGARASATAGGPADPLPVVADSPGPPPDLMAPAGGTPEAVVAVMVSPSPGASGCTCDGCPAGSATTASLCFAAPGVVGCAPGRRQPLLAGAPAARLQCPRRLPRTPVPEPSRSRTDAAASCGRVALREPRLGSKGSGV